MSDTINVTVGRIGQFVLSIEEAVDLQRQLDHKLGKRFAAVAQYVVEPTVLPDQQMQLDLGTPTIAGTSAAPAPVLNHFDMSTQLFHD